ncbi:DNA protecting protein DprA [Arthrobacter crystallopoietes BAB-32]|uniref:DNA protecting protein DprA n=1 Tax=Arthrobacter crystallopoietes BAB-32 TaxID=1246476 RepID=N1VC24_9MICC|nr:DNA-processing protein DprA [Arthrobacter crystallopoietes]EMY35823.1 DNA protecting protein DprA [Arthrobacter crystallopoietes BAB-32]
MDAVSEERRARAALARLMEPSDWVGLGLVASVGPIDALRIATGALAPGNGLEAELLRVLDRRSGQPEQSMLQDGLQRWAPRVKDLAPERDLATMERLGGQLLVPGDELWPPALADLELGEPLCLWVRGDPALAVPPANRTVALVGSRDSTNYGNSVTGDIAAGLTQRGYCVVSGGAYGIDAQAHRSALAAAEDPSLPATMAVMACGLDRYYPAGNEELLRSIAARGLLLAEVPPGSAPTRWRFLQRNRLIAALSGTTVVVEARWRSGALNTAHHAAGLGRPVGAVPGSVYSANSAGTHRLLRDGSAVCVTDAAEVAELAGPFDALASSTPQEVLADHDGLGVEDLLLLDALPVRKGVSVDKLVPVAGLPARTVLAGLGRLQARGLAAQDGSGWRRAQSS